MTVSEFYVVLWEALCNGSIGAIVLVAIPVILILGVLVVMALEKEQNESL